jgi:hypothetical protein
MIEHSNLTEKVGKQKQNKTPLILIVFRVSSFPLLDIMFVISYQNEVI